MNDQHTNDGNKLTPRPMRESVSEMAEIVMPNDANPLNALVGGRLMHWIDLAGAMAAHRHSRQRVVTASIDHMDFLVPVRVGDLVILRASVNRVFHTSMEVGVKVWVENYTQVRFERSVDASLNALRTDYVDLLLLHWPGSVVPLEDQIGWLNALVHAGKVLSIGVSNFNRALLRHAVELSDIPLATNQFEYHPYLNQASLIAATRQAGVSVTAYCAMAVGRVFSETALQTIARRYGKSVSQIVLRWLLQQEGVVALSRTERQERIHENLDIFDFSLEESDMDAIFRLARPGSRIVDPPGLAPLWDPTPRL